MADNKTTALYCREVFTDAEKITAKKILMRMYAEFCGYGECVCYRDNDENGSTFDRSALKRLTADIRSGNVSRSFVFNLEQSARDAELLYVVDQFYGRIRR